LSAVCDVRNHCGSLGTRIYDLQQFSTSCGMRPSPVFLLCGVALHVLCCIVLCRITEQVRLGATLTSRLIGLIFKKNYSHNAMYRKLFPAICSFTFTVIRLLINLWSWKPFQQCDIGVNGQQTDRRTTAGHWTERWTTPKHNDLHLLPVL